MVSYVAWGINAWAEGSGDHKPEIVAMETQGKQINVENRKKKNQRFSEGESGYSSNDI